MANVCQALSVAFAQWPWEAGAVVITPLCSCRKLSPVEGADLPETTCGVSGGAEGSRPPAATPGLPTASGLKLQPLVGSAAPRLWAPLCAHLMLAPGALQAPAHGPSHALRDPPGSQPLLLPVGTPAPGRMRFCTSLLSLRPVLPSELQRPLLKLGGTWRRCPQPAPETLAFVSHPSGSNFPEQGLPVPQTRCSLPHPVAGVPEPLPLPQLGEAPLYSDCICLSLMREFPRGTAPDSVCGVVSAQDSVLKEEAGRQIRA